MPNRGQSMNEAGPQNVFMYVCVYVRCMERNAITYHSRSLRPNTGIEITSQTARKANPSQLDAGMQIQMARPGQTRAGWLAALGAMPCRGHDYYLSHCQVIAKLLRYASEHRDSGLTGEELLPIGRDAAFKFVGNINCN